MSELRWNPVLREWVAYATHRQNRTFLPPAEYCPLCPTKPGGFPTEVPRESYGIAVFENRFPSFTPDAPEPDAPDDPFQKVAAGRGVCEVVLYSSEHGSTLAGMTERHIGNLTRVWADRYRELAARDDVSYVYIFENKGEAVGVTLHHPHGQVYGYPFVPPVPKREIDGAREYLANNGSPLHADLLASEQRDGRRVVVAGEHFTAFVPFFARYPYEVHLYANRAVPNIAAFSEDEVRDFARTMKRLLSGYDALFGFSLPYIMAMHQSPTDGKNYDGLAHFHVEFYPPNRTENKLKYLAGSEAGAGAFIMDAAPEETAGRLRAAIESASGMGERR